MIRILSAASIAAGLCLAGSSPAAAQAPSAKAINTGGPQGAYHSLFCPPIPVALAGAYFQGYACTPVAIFSGAPGSLAAGKGGTQAAEHLAAAAEATKRAVERQFNN